MRVMIAARLVSGTGGDTPRLLLPLRFLATESVYTIAAAAMLVGFVAQFHDIGSDFV